MCAAPTAKIRTRPQTVNEHVWLNSGVQDLGDWLLTRVRAAAYFASLGGSRDPFFTVQIATRPAPTGTTPADARRNNSDLIDRLKRNYYRTSRGRRRLIDDPGYAPVLRVLEMTAVEVARTINTRKRPTRRRSTQSSAS